MKNQYILLPRDFSDTPDRDLGVFGTEQKKLLEKQIGIPKVAVVPIKTLKAIASANSLTDHISKVLVQTNFHDPVACTKLKKTIEESITKAKIPQPILQELGEVYHAYFAGEKVTIFAGTTAPTESSKKISGDANVFSELLHLWAQSTISALFKSTARHIYPSLLSQSFVIQECFTSKAHGIIYTRNPKTGTKTSVLVISTPVKSGYYDTTNGKEYEVDVRTWNIISRPKNTSKETYALSDPQVIELAKIANTIKKQHLEHKQMCWDLVRNKLIVSKIENFHPSHTIQQKYTTITKVYASAGNPLRAREYHELPISGIGYLKSEYAILSLGSHPQSLLKSGKQTYIQKTLEKTLTSFSNIPDLSHIIYKAFDVPSDDLIKLPHATTYETVEKNAWLGVRGAEKQLLAPDLLRTEIAALCSFAATTPLRISLLLPFVRSATEMRRLLRLINTTQLHKHSIETWIQIATLQPLLAIDEFPLESIDGISLQLDTICNLITGVAPTQSHNGEYSVSPKTLTTLLKPFFETLRTTIHRELPVHIQMEQYNPEYVQLAVWLGADAVTVRPAVAPLAKACIIDTETAPFRKASESSVRISKL